MTGVEEYEGRIAAALARIGRALDRVERRDAPGAGDGTPGAEGTGALQEVSALVEALDEERMANAQLQERLRVVRERSEAQAAAAAARISTLEAELTTLRQSHADLLAAAETLRLSVTNGADDAALVNRAMQAEIEALRAARSSDLAEVSAVIAALRPILQEGS